jgi:hypothetical protein
MTNAVFWGVAKPQKTAFFRDLVGGLMLSVSSSSI